MSGPDNHRRWFAVHPDRALRVRPETDWETERFGCVPAGYTVKVIIARAPSEPCLLATENATDLDDYDDIELRALLEDADL